MSWSWPLFLWGALAGPAWVVATVVAFRLSARYVGGDAARTTSRFATRYPVWAALGIPVGLLSAGFTTRWPDLVFTGYAVIAVLAPLVMLPKLRRTAEAAECASGGACSTCPITCDRRAPVGQPS